MVAHAKEYVRFSLDANREPKTDRVIRIALTRFPKSTIFSIRHAMALGAIQARNYNVARRSFLGLLNELEPGSEPWGKAIWALARMEEGLEEHGAASVWYFEMAESAKIPPRFRIQSMLRGFKQLAASGGAVDTPKVSKTVSSILKNVDDYKVALDAARQLALAGSSFLALKLEAANRGQTLADLTLKKSKTAQEKLTILEYVARRQSWDLGDHVAILERWDTLPLDDKVEFAATNGSLWYGYLSLVFRALVACSRVEEGQGLAASVIDGDAATPEGYVIVGTEYATWLIKNGKTETAFEYFDWIAKEAPTHRKAAVAHYWLAIRNLKNGLTKEAKAAAQKVRKCYGGVPALLEEWEFDAAALMILHDNIAESALITSSVSYSEYFIQGALSRIQRDMKEL
jgi:hypothetical protein